MNVFCHLAEKVASKIECIAKLLYQSFWLAYLMEKRFAKAPNLKLTIMAGNHLIPSTSRRGTGTLIGIES